MARNGRKMVMIKKRDAREWLDGDNLEILRGIALQCLSYRDVAARIGVTEQTLANWRKKHPKIDEAIEIGRGEANAVLISVTFDNAVSGNEAAMDRWWRYRIGPMERPDEGDGERAAPVVIVDDIRKAIGRARDDPAE